MRIVEETSQSQVVILDTVFARTSRPVTTRYCRYIVRETAGYRYSCHKFVNVHACARLHTLTHASIHVSSRRGSNRMQTVMSSFLDFFEACFRTIWTSTFNRFHNVKTIERTRSLLLIIFCFRHGNALSLYLITIQKRLLSHEKTFWSIPQRNHTNYFHCRESSTLTLAYTFLEFNTKITLIAIWLPYHVGKSDSMFLFNMKNIKIINDESSLGFLGGIDRDIKRTEEN